MRSCYHNVSFVFFQFSIGSKYTLNTVMNYKSGYKIDFLKII